MDIFNALFSLTLLNNSGPRSGLMLFSILTWPKIAIGEMAISRLGMRYLTKS